MFHKAWSAPPRTGSQNPARQSPTPARHIHLVLVPVSDYSKAHSEPVVPVSGCLCFLSQSPKQALKLLPQASASVLLTVFTDSFARCSFEKSKGLPRRRKIRKKRREMPAKKKVEGKAKAGSGESLRGDTGSAATATVVRRQMPPRACKSKSQSAASPSLSPSRQQPSR
ncbi:uncharacterized protein LOC117186119 [Drosophila miranda]|uniref:uncharacterized protein LOC117186119 n=1 Tax=Drosophila miranda TaxID=7229 RepID=UPI00143F2F67|nr:uncharacterized protein LOC117186119 [Drosophila miranda]